MVVLAGLLRRGDGPEPARSARAAQAPLGARANARLGGRREGGPFPSASLEVGAGARWRREKGSTYVRRSVRAPSLAPTGISAGTKGAPGGADPALCTHNLAASVLLNLNPRQAAMHAGDGTSRRAIAVDRLDRTGQPRRRREHDAKIRTNVDRRLFHLRDDRDDHD